MNWGLGHATRCVPIIKALLEQGFEPILASDGAALLFLKKEFPNLKMYELPGYGITYSKKGAHLKWKLGVQSFRIQKTIKAEYRKADQIVEKENLAGIISDNRFGVHSKKVPSVYITHQLNVLSGLTTKLSSRLHRHYIERFDACWVPDFSDEPNLSGELGHFNKKRKIEPIYIGTLSRFERQEMDIKYTVLVLLSGPEPQRAILEEKLKVEFLKSKDNVLFIRGVVEDEQEKTQENNLTIYNFLSGMDLQNAFNQSEVVVCRSGYSSVMDLAKLGKKAFFIPTPGQPEQLYLAERFEVQKTAPFCEQNAFSIEKLKVLKDYKGFQARKNSLDFSRLFALFKGE